MGIVFRTPCIMHAITREPAWFLRSQRFPALRCEDRTLFSVYQSALKPRDYWGCAVLRMTDDRGIAADGYEIILDGAGTNTRLCRGVLRVAFGVGRGGSHPPMQRLLNADEPRNGAASQVSASHYGYNVPY